MSGIQFAKREHKCAPLHSDFAKDFVKRQFGEETAALIYSLLPVYSKGKHQGLVKGFVHWDKVHEGGWVRESRFDRGHVERPGTRNVCISAAFDDVGGKIGAGDKSEVETIAAYHLRVCRAFAHVFGNGKKPYASEALTAKIQELLGLWNQEQLAFKEAAEKVLYERVESELLKYGCSPTEAKCLAMEAL